ncbi:Tetratricopeptide repeat-containing protein [Bryocella elongata]|uniref:Tetratricopeptide repeat-containing protein n=1 Tax=Bryocella elongata TaxID=863522 RepID=A0A1H6B633_9BACT|nr:tetratricopeptide repeat protein [Bryocella elongata]SEG55667.1 Tetratricopeptide repeat-containing protein [Bryocella elongata]
MSEAVEWTERGRLARRDGDDQEALRCYQQAAMLYEAVDDRTGLAHTLRHCSELQAKLGDGAGALESIARAYEIYEANEPAPLEMANTFRIGALAHEAAREPWKAEREWLNALQLYTEIGVQAGVDEATARLKRLGVG